MRPKRKKPTKRRRKAKRKQKASTALVKAASAPVAKRTPWVLRADQIALLQRTVAKGTTPDEFALFLWVARKHRLDPMTRQLHAVKRWSKAEGKEVMAIQIGIDGYRSLAAKNHRDYGGVDEAEYEYNADKSVKLARIRVWKKGFEHPTVGVAFWSEYAPVDLAKPQSFMWAKMPKHMLAKCAESLALRKAYPDLADIYTDEEMAQADDDFSPEGREITVGGRLPSEQKVLEKPEYQKQFWPAAPPAIITEPEPIEKGSARIQDYKEVQWRKGTYVKVRFGNQMCTCWEKDLWPHLKSGVGQLAKLGLLTKGNYVNIVEIYSIGNQTFSQIEGKSVPDIQRGDDVKRALSPAVLQPARNVSPPKDAAKTDENKVIVSWMDKKPYISAPPSLRDNLLAMNARENQTTGTWTTEPHWVPILQEICQDRGIEFEEK